MGAEPGVTLQAAAALELVQAFSLVHDDLPALDDTPSGAVARASGSESEQGPRRAFGDELSLLFQIADDSSDGDGSAAAEGPERARGRADEAAARARARLDELDADTSVLTELVAGLAARTP